MYDKHHSKESNDKNRISHLGIRFITNGIINKRIFPGEDIPEGFSFGMTKRK